MAADGCDLLCLDLELAERLRCERSSDRDVREAARCARALADLTRALSVDALARSDELCVCDLAG